MGVILRGQFRFPILLLATYLTAPSWLPANDTIAVSGALLKFVSVINVAAPRAGIITESSLKEGMMVTVGTRLARIDHRTAELEVRQATVEWKAAKRQAENDISVRYAEKAHAVARAELERLLSINRNIANSISAQEIERQRLEADRTALEIDQARHNLAIVGMERDIKKANLDVASHRLEQHNVVAPIDGKVVHIERRLGEWVNPGDLVARVVSITRLRAEGFVSSPEAAQGLIGQKARIHIEISPEQVLDAEGEVVFESPEADAVNRQVRLWVEFTNDDPRIRPGLRANLEINRVAKPAK